MNMSGIVRKVLVEGVGTFILVLFGCGSIAVSVWFNAPYGLWSIAAMFALGVIFGVYVSRGISGGHLNPAVTISMAIFTDFGWHKVMPYIMGQLLDAFLAACVIWFTFDGVAAVFEVSNGIVRGALGSELSMMGYATFAPNPAVVAELPAATEYVNNARWFLSEAFFTAFLLFGIFFLTDPHNTHAPPENLVPLFIGLLVMGIIAFSAPLSMTAINPARDLGPRIFAALAGWKKIAFPGPNNGWWIPSVSAIVGGVIGSGFYRVFFKPLFVRTQQQ